MKKIINVMFVGMLAIVMAFSASAAVIITPTPATQSGSGVITTGIRGINERDYISLLENNAAAHGITLNNKEYITSLYDLTDLEIKPGDIIRIRLTGNLFVDRNGNPIGGSGDNVSRSALSSGDIQVRPTYTSGQGAAQISLEGTRSASFIKIEFSKSPAYFGQKFSYAVHLSSRGSRKSATRIAIKGVIETDTIEVSSGDDYVDLSEGASVKAVSTVRDIELYLGENVSIIRTLARGNTYSGIATTDVLSKDESLFSKYRGLQYIYRLETVKLKAEGNIVRFDLGEVFYVYNSNGTYIGTSNKALPYWTTYYLSDQKYSHIEVVR